MFAKYTIEATKFCQQNTTLLRSNQFLFYQSTLIAQ